MHENIQNEVFLHIWLKLDKLLRHKNESRQNCFLVLKMEMPSIAIFNLPIFSNIHLYYKNSFLIRIDFMSIHNSQLHKTVSSNNRIIWFSVIAFWKEPMELFQNYISCLTSTIFNKTRNKFYWILVFKEKPKWKMFDDLFCQYLRMSYEHH